MIKRAFTESFSRDTNWIATNCPTQDESQALIDFYALKMYRRYADLTVLAQKPRDTLTNTDLAGIFEYYCCVKLTEKYSRAFYHYEDILPAQKEANGLTQRDTGVDLSDLRQCIVQCKLRKKSLCWKECATFFGSQNTTDPVSHITSVRWSQLIIARNDSCVLSRNLQDRLHTFVDQAFSVPAMLDFCDNLLSYADARAAEAVSAKRARVAVDIAVAEARLVLRPYQAECLEFFRSPGNRVLCLPTGSGKNCIAIESFRRDQKVLVLVPRIILMEQLDSQTQSQRPEFAGKTRMIGGAHTDYCEAVFDAEDQDKNVFVCVYNSVDLVNSFAHKFDKIVVDEAHHISRPRIYDFDSDSDSYSEEFEDCDGSDEDSANASSESYIEVIEGLARFDNNVYMSATIDPLDGFDFHKRELRELIDAGYLCDYDIHIPIFSAEADNASVCNHLLRHYRSIIVYCRSQREGREVCEAFNHLQRNSCEYVDCHTALGKRRATLDKFKAGVLPFVVNVRVLTEGLDAPITQGVCFMHMPSNKTAAIQCIGRALRLYKDKTLAHVILPFSQDEDGESVSNLLKIMAKNDVRMHQAMQKRNEGMGGYVSLRAVADDWGDEEEREEEGGEMEEDDDGEGGLTIAEFRHTLIFDRMGCLLSGHELWMKSLEKLRKFLEQNKKRPASRSKDADEKRFGIWIANQQKNYKTCEWIMKNEEIRALWKAFVDEHVEYFMTNEEIWMKLFEKTKDFIKQNKKRPAGSSKDVDEKQLAQWIGHQQINYKNYKDIMKNEEIRALWKAFVDEHAEYFMTNEEIWMSSLDKTKDFIEKNKKKPSQHSKDANEKRLAQWIGNQQISYKTSENIMKNEEIRALWKAFVDEHAEYFLTNEEIWMSSLDKTKDFIETNKKRPANSSKNADEKRLAKWISNQQITYKNYKDIMKNEEIRALWKAFVDEHPALFSC